MTTVFRPLSYLEFPVVVLVDYSRQEKRKCLVKVSTRIRPTWISADGLDKATTDRNARTLRELVKQPDNKNCADCRKNGKLDMLS